MLHRRSVDAASCWLATIAAAGAETRSAQANSAGEHRLFDGPDRHVGRRDAGADQRPTICGASRSTSRRPQRRRRQAQGRVRGDTTIGPSPASGENLREADHRRQGRSAAGALGHAIPLRHRAGAGAVRIPGGRQHGSLGRDTPNQAGLLWFPTSAMPDKHRRRADAMMKAQNVKSAAIIVQHVAVIQGDQELPRAGAEAAGIELEVTTEYPPDIKDMTATADSGQAGQRRRGVRPRLSRRLHPLHQAGEGAGHERAVPVHRDRPHGRVLRQGRGRLFRRRCRHDRATGHRAPTGRAPSRSTTPMRKKYGEEPDYLDTALPRCSSRSSKTRWRGRARQGEDPRRSSPRTRSRRSTARSSSRACRT